MKTQMQRTALYVAMVALAFHGNGFAEGVFDGASPPVLPATEAFAPDALAPMEARFSTEQIEQLVAPIALYPDALLAQVLMASGYPLEVVQASRWATDHGGLTGQALDTAVASQVWDPSVKTLVFFPSVLQRMSDHLDWTQDLGDAFLSQENDVMDAVQRLRKQAYDAGNLASNDKLKVTSYGEHIVVEPADPATVYVPTYNPTRVYGSTWVPTTTYYPAVYNDAYYPAAPAYTTADSTPTWLSFGAGALVGALLTSVILWDDDDDDDHHHYVYDYGPRYWDNDWVGPRRWHPGWRGFQPRRVNYGDYYVDRSKHTNIQNNYYGRPWQHNPRHRQGVSYRDVNTTKRYLRVDDATAIARTRPSRLATPRDRPGGSADFAGRRDRIRQQEGLGRLDARPDAPRDRSRQGVDGLRDELSRERPRREEAQRRDQPGPAGWGGRDDAVQQRRERPEPGRQVAPERESRDRAQVEAMRRGELRAREQPEEAGRALGQARDRSRADESMRPDLRQGQPEQRSRADEAMRRDARPDWQAEQQRAARAQQERQQADQQRAVRAQQERQQADQQRAVRAQQERQQADQQRGAMRAQQQRQQAEQQRAVQAQQQRQQAEQQRAVQAQQQRQQAEQQRSRPPAEKQPQRQERKQREPFGQ